MVEREIAGQRKADLKQGRRKEESGGEVMAEFECLEARLRNVRGSPSSQLTIPAGQRNSEVVEDHTHTHTHNSSLPTPSQTGTNPQMGQGGACRDEK